MIIDHIKSNKSNIILVFITICFFIYILNFDDSKNSILDISLGVFIFTLSIYTYLTRVFLSTRVYRTTKINTFNTILYLLLIMFFSITWINDMKFSLSFMLLIYSISGLLSNLNHFLKLEKNLTFKNQDKILTPVLEGFYNIEPERIILKFIEGEYQIRTRFIRKKKLAFLKSSLIIIEERLIEDAKHHWEQFERI
jgi:hypothetical protein